jgi:hypothetical protein
LVLTQVTWKLAALLEVLYGSPLFRKYRLHSFPILLSLSISSPALGLKKSVRVSQPPPVILVTACNFYFNPVVLLLIFIQICAAVLGI